MIYSSWVCVSAYSANWSKPVTLVAEMVLYWWTLTVTVYVRLWSRLGIDCNSHTEGHTYPQKGNVAMHMLLHIHLLESYKLVIPLSSVVSTQARSKIKLSLSLSIYYVRTHCYNPCILNGECHPRSDDCLMLYTYKLTCTRPGNKDLARWICQTYPRTWYITKLESPVHHWRGGRWRSNVPW